MKIAIPVTEDSGWESPVHGHFGSAPLFIRVDSETMEIKTLRNPNYEHIHGTCNTLGLIKDIDVDAMIFGGMGARALQLLNQTGIKVFKASDSIVKKAVADLAKGLLPEMTVDGACSQHGCHK